MRARPLVRRNCLSGRSTLLGLSERAHAQGRCRQAARRAQELSRDLRRQDQVLRLRRNQAAGEGPTVSSVCAACGLGKDPETGVQLHARWCLRPLEMPPSGPVTLDLFRRRANAVGHKDRNLNGELCSFCLVLPGITREHFIPRSHGGGNTDANVVPACGLCNGFKSNKGIFEWFPGLQRYHRSNRFLSQLTNATRFGRRVAKRTERMLARQQRRVEAGGRRFGR